MCRIPYAFALRAVADSLLTVPSWDFDLDPVVPYSDGAESQGTVAASRGKYYFEDGDLYVQVEDVLFKVYKHLLSPSAISNTVAGSATDGSNQGHQYLFPRSHKKILRTFYGSFTMSASLDMDSVFRKSLAF
ncbi:hypothetical protein PLEOSDRAFT_1107380 [Pleurotus ostreatus PC15]|uniref:Uncharacterized protein n=2 Tax=Pleurotus TaxID=5320 RepID=A0A067NBX5_PLEO1|nr:hypothetical protein CCMSSC00406_0002194 [Pleurotus cornucopiae]KDQ24450.1 hypothetical protein PLEOSDRAFT_1107380 [Pleurotus ostreatus PC15]